MVIGSYNTMYYFIVQAELVSNFHFLLDTVELEYYLFHIDVMCFSVSVTVAARAI